jgi:translation initiation factor IF-3
LIGAEGEQLGIIPIKEAIERARTADLDLVEVAGNSRPPVCRIMDYGRYKYELSKKKKDARKKQHSVELKEMRFRPKVDVHDYEFKTKHIREFLEEGNKVKIFVMFRGREMAHTEFGRELLQRVIEDMKEIANVEVPPKQEGRRMNMVIAPTPEVVKNAAQVRADKVEARQKLKDEERGDHPDGADVTDVSENGDSAETAEIVVESASDTSAKE